MSLFADPDRVMRKLMRHRMLFTTHSGPTWDGVLMEVDDNTVVLRDAEVIATDGTRTKADGEVLLPRVDVAYVQRI